MQIQNSSHHIFPGRNIKSSFLPENIKIICELENIAVFGALEPERICDLGSLTCENILAISILYPNTELVVFSNDVEKSENIEKGIREFGCKNVSLYEYCALSKDINLGGFDLIFAAVNNAGQDQVLLSSERRFISKYLKNMGALLLNYDAGVHSKFTMLIVEFIKSISKIDGEENTLLLDKGVEKITKAILNRDGWKVNKLGYLNENIRRAHNYSSKGISSSLMPMTNFSMVKRQMEALGIKYVAQSDYKVNCQKSFITADLRALIHDDGGTEDLIDFLLLNRNRSDIYVRTDSNFKMDHDKECVGICLKNPAADALIFNTVVGRQKIADSCGELIISKAKEGRYKLTDFSRDLGEGSRKAQEYFRKCLASDQFVAGYEEFELDILEPNTSLRYTTEDKKIIDNCQSLRSGFQIISPKIKSKAFSFSIEDTAILHAHLENYTTPQIESLIQDLEIRSQKKLRIMDQYRARISLIRRFLGL